MNATRRPLPLLQRRLLPALVAVPLALTLAACGGNGTDSASGASTTSDATDTAASTSPQASPSSGTTGTTGTTAAADGSDAPALTAASTALATVSGSRVLSLEREAGGWEVHVATANGTESELRLSADGTTITRGPVTDAQDDTRDRDDDRDDNDGDDRDDRDDLARDRAENERLLKAAAVDHAAAVKAARTAVPTGDLSSLDLDVERGQARWDVTFGDNTPDEQTVTVDAADGKVLGTQRDD